MNADEQTAMKNKIIALMERGAADKEAPAELMMLFLVPLYQIAAATERCAHFLHNQDERATVNR